MILKIDKAQLLSFIYLFNKETGTIYLRARYYAPSTGRFLSEDPIRDGLNWYTYANGNPIFFIDPSGYSAYKANQGDTTIYLPVPGTPKDWLGSLGFPEVIKNALNERIWEVLNGIEPKSLEDLILEFPVGGPARDGLTLGEKLRNIYGNLLLASLTVLIVTV